MTLFKERVSLYRPRCREGKEGGALSEPPPPSWGSLSDQKEGASSAAAIQMRGCIYHRRYYLLFFKRVHQAPPAVSWLPLCGQLPSGTASSRIPKARCPVPPAPARNPVPILCASLSAPQQACCAPLCDGRLLPLPNFVDFSKESGFSFDFLYRFCFRFH